MNAGAPFVLQRTDGMFVAKPGSEHSYTRFLSRAQRFDTIAEADVGRCLNERIVPYLEAVES